jgi:transposase
LLPRADEAEGRAASGARADGAAGILFVLRTGTQWHKVPGELGCSGKSCWRRPRGGQAAWVWAALHRALLERRHGSGRLVELDPLQCFAHADVNADPRAAALTMSLLNLLAAETGATVLATRHVRKEREAPRNAQEARHLIRGGSALTDQARVAVVLWAPDEADARRACRTLGADHAPNAVVRGAVVKGNDGADRSTWTLPRGPTGMLRDLTHALRARGGGRAAHLAALVSAIAAAAEAGKPFTKTGANGLLERRAELGEAPAGVAKARLEGMADEPLRSGRVVAALATGTTVTRLDRPDGPFAAGAGAFSPGAGTARRGRKVA